MRGSTERMRAAAEQWVRRHSVMGGAVMLIARTARDVARTRVVGLAAESAFFSLLSLPSLLLGLIGTLGHLTGVLGVETIQEIRIQILDLSADALSQDAVDNLVEPLVDSFFQGAQGGLLSVTFLVSLWSGSRAVNVFIEAITIAFGLNGLRGYVSQRILALLTYLGALVFALVVLPVMVVGPDVVHSVLPVTVGYLNLLYWPAVVALSVVAVALLYALAVPARMALWRHLPGAVLATAILVLGSLVLRVYLDASFGQVTLYGSLSAPLAVLIWLWIMAMAVLIGSGLNAEIDLTWPTPRTAEARAALSARRFVRVTRQVERHEQVLQTAHERNGSDDADADDADAAHGDGADTSAEEAGAEDGGHGAGRPGAAPSEAPDTEDRRPEPQAAPAPADEPRTPEPTATETRLPEPDSATSGTVSPDTEGDRA